MFNPADFTRALENLAALLQQLGEGAAWNFGTIELRLAMNGRAIPKSFVEEIGKAAVGTGASNHAKIRMREILDRDLAHAARTLRQHYARASGGLPAEIWRKAELSFVLANGGSVGVTWTISSFSPSFPHSRGNIPLPSDSAQFPAISARLARHASCNLAGPLRHFELGQKNNHALPYEISAPSPEAALARLCILMNETPERYPHIREVIPTEAAMRAARALLKNIEQALLAT